MAFERLKKKITKENLWLYILTLLKNGPVYGYEVRDKIKEKFGFDVAKITTYVVLYKLEREGLVRSMKENEKSQRKYYYITEKGRKTLEEGLKFLKKIINSLE
ncbi:MAG: PadR family transcriptional regulator [Candidatus Verstraetearchaeota archaeon]|jgi:DNA-binding PadR family transcriptional regulator|nr:PadR family transcriptional regulator [Candidatus Verstraetearchaeota archaeon]